MTWFKRAARHGIAGSTTALALACGGSGDDDGPTGNTGSIQVSVNTASISIQQGGNASVTVSVTRAGGFSGTVTLSHTGLPTGVVATINPTQLTGTTASATIEIVVPASVAVGSYTATVLANGLRVSQATTTFQLNVVPPPNYTLTVTPTQIVVNAGSSSSATVNITRTNFTEGVTFALQNAPAGITASFNPSPSTTNSSTIVVSVAANVASDYYQVIIQGTAAGIPARTASLTVYVNTPPSGPNNVEYQFCDPSAVPAFFAFQDGTNAWQRVTPVTSGTVTKFGFNIAQGRGGVLIVSQTATSLAADVLRVGRTLNARQFGTTRASRRYLQRRRSGTQSLTSSARRSFAVDVYETTVIYATTAELAQDGTATCALTAPTKTITGNIIGVPNGAYGIASFGNVVQIFEGGVATNPVSFDVPAGPKDLVGSLVTIPGAHPSRLILFRNLNIPDGGSLPAAIDYNGPASRAPATATVTISGGSGDNLETFVDFVTPNNGVGLWFELTSSPAAARPWAGFSVNDMQSGDMHALIVFASAPNDDFRVTGKYVGPVTNQTVAMGPAMNATTASQIAAGAYPRFRFQGTLPTEYNKLAWIDVMPTNSGNTYSMVATGAYLAAAGSALTYDFTMPDVAGLPGFPVASRLAAGSNDLATTGDGFTGQGVFEPRPTLGGEFKAAVRITSVTVP